MTRTPGNNWQRSGVLSNEQRAAGYYRIAYQCAEAKQRGCSGYCGNCPYNVSLYEADSRDAVLIKTTAAMDQQKYVEYQNYKNAAEAGPVIACLMILGFCIWIVCSIGSCFQSCVTPSQTTAMQQAVYQPVFQYTAEENSPAVTRVEPAKPKTPTVAAVQTTPAVSKTSVKEPDIGYYLDEVNRTIRDTNGDGLVNCIDYAILFKKAYGEDARIIRNYNPATGMNHLFNAIPSGNSLEYIEPQGTANRYGMPQVWGEMYNSAYDIDQTEYWFMQAIY